MDVDPGPLLKSPVRDWSELPLDALSAIFMKLGTIEILMGAGLACRSWLAAAKSPELWRFVDMTRHKVIFSKGTDILCAMAKVAIDRSDGWMESFWAQKFVTCELLDYMTGRANSLKSIRLIGCAHFWDVSLARLAAKCPLLEEIECSHQRLPANFFKYVGTVCPQLKRLRIHRQWIASDPFRRAMEMEHQYYEHEDDEKQNENAFAIAENMHELRLLQMAGNRLTNKGVYAILKGCPRLKCFDISECYNVDDELRARCAKIKHVWLPGNRTVVQCPNRCVVGGNEGEDDGFTLHDLWEAKVHPLHGEAAMDDDFHGYDYWEEYLSRSSPVALTGAM
uniref:F-box domain-containing protein n=1 Tax=Arundo donax TaxID=35708 RepID=A0A0A8ZA95_ARUDO